RCRQTTLLQFLLEGVVRDVFPGARQRALQVVLADIELELIRLRQKNVLDDEIIEQVQLGGEGLLFRERPPGILRSPVGHLDVVGAKCSVRRQPPMYRQSLPTRSSRALLDRPRPTRRPQVRSRK